MPTAACQWTCSQEQAVGQGPAGRARRQAGPECGSRQFRRLLGPGGQLFTACLPSRSASLSPPGRVLTLLAYGSRALGHKGRRYRCSSLCGAWSPWDFPDCSVTVRSHCP